jgi:integrase/recombinase XerD
MPVIFRVTSDIHDGLCRLRRWEPAVHAGDSRPVCSRDRSGELVVRVGVPLAEVYLEFLGWAVPAEHGAGRAAYDLKVFFSVVAKRPYQIQPADVLAFVTAQRTGRAGGRGMLQPVALGAELGGVSAATVRRRLSIVSGFFAFLQARGDVAANPVPRALPGPGSAPGSGRGSRLCAPRASYRDLVPG